MPLDQLDFARAHRLARTIERTALTLGILGSGMLMGLALVFG